LNQVYFLITSSQINKEEISSQKGLKRAPGKRTKTKKQEDKEEEDNKENKERKKRQDISIYISIYFFPISLTT